MRLFRLYGLDFSAGPSALAGTLVLWAVFTGVLLVAGRFDLPTALLGGAAVTLLHWISETAHQIGHAVAARQVGYPMTGVHFYLVFGRSIYPTDEPTLPGATHIRRALGGPPASLIVGAMLASIALLLPGGSLGQWIVGLGALISAGLFGLGAFLPLGFTDGSTILRYWGKP